MVDSKKAELCFQIFLKTKQLFDKKYLLLT